MILLQFKSVGIRKRNNFSIQFFSLRNRIRNTWNNRKIEKRDIVISGSCKFRSNLTVSWKIKNSIK